MGGAAKSVVKAVASVSKFFGRYSGWISAIQIGIQVISWLRKPDIPDTPTMQLQTEQNAKAI